MKKLALLSVNEQSKSIISQMEPTISPLPFLKEYEVTIFRLSKNQCSNLLSDKWQEFDVFLNLCDGAANDDRPGIEVVHFLENHCLSFTGANSNFYEPTRIEMKIAAEKNHVKFPRYQYFFNKDEIINFRLNFPCIVKHHNSYSSIGLTKESVVHNRASLEEQTINIIEKFGGALVEEFIDGDEYTVLIVSIDNNTAYAFDSAKIIFPYGETFKHFDLKWNQHSSMKYVKTADEWLNNYLKECSLKIYRQMNGNGYARFDYRVNKNGEVYFLELNPNCSIYYPRENASSADEILFFYKDGHQKFTDYILKYALQRFN